MPTNKTIVIEELFKARWNSSTRTLTSSVVSLADVRKMIAEKTPRLSDRNPANFLKDFIRIRRRANKNWPQSVWEAGYTARQVTEKGRCFEFVAVKAGQEEPFPASAPHPLVSQEHPAHKIESLSLPLASRVLGRSDESWLIQVAVKLRLIETHLALFSPRRIVQVDHLQTGVKLRRTEIDAMFLAIEEHEVVEGVMRERQEAIVTCEAKGRNDDILLDQIAKQAMNALKMPGVTQNIIIPMAIKAYGKSIIQVVEYSAILRQDAESFQNLTEASMWMYELCPPVPGIGE